MVVVASMGLDWGGPCLEQFLWFECVARFLLQMVPKRIEATIGS